MSARWAKPDIEHEVIRCRRLEVVDEDDIIRAVLECDNDTPDAVTLEMRSPKGQLGLILRCHGESSRLGLFHFRTGTEMVTLELDRNGKAELCLEGLDRKRYVIDNKDDEEDDQ